MKRFFFSAGIFTLAILLFASCSNQKKNATGFSVAINIQGLKPATKVFLEKGNSNGQLEKLDSVTLKDGKGTITGKVKSPERRYLIIENSRVFIPLWLENSPITVKAEAKTLMNPTITGSKTQDEYIAFQDSTRHFTDSLWQVSNQLRKAYAQKKESIIKKDKKEEASIENQRINYVINYIRRHNKSVVSAYIATTNFYVFSVKELDTITHYFDSGQSNNHYVKQFKVRAAAQKRIAIGQHFINFTLNDTTNKPVSLASVVKDHKYTLVDFWASWCGPCRAEDPNVVAAYKSFHRKGFTIMGVSLDNNHKDWMKAIKHDGLTWTQVSDLKGWGSPVAKLYGVYFIPKNILINQRGIIVAHTLRGTALQKELKKLMN